MREILWRFGFGADWRKLDSWAPLTALEVGQAMHNANAHRCRSCNPEVPDNSGCHTVECGRPDHHFYGGPDCEHCMEDGIMALNELHERDLVELHVSGTPTEKAKEMQFERESADLLDPGRSRYEKVGARDD